jgi:GT2 family glycosyltransferase
VSSLSVAAIVVSHAAGNYLEKTLSDLANQTHQLKQVVVVDTAGEDKAVDLAAKHNFSIIQPGDLKLGAAIDAGIMALGGQPSWVWILHDDSAPEPEALERLARAAEISPSVAVIGPKLLSWEKPIEIQQMGLTVTHTGKPFLLVSREYDQGQHDSTGDTLAVSTAGMLVSLGLWQKLGGLNDSSPAFAQDLEFCLRARASGFRVIVEAGARVHHAGLSMQSQRRKSWVGGNRRQGLAKAHIHLATAILPLAVVIPLYLLLPFAFLVSIPKHLLSKDPARIYGQLTGWLWAWLTAPARFKARAQLRSSGNLAPTRGLFATRDQLARRRSLRFEYERFGEKDSRGILSSGALWFTLLPLFASLPMVPSGALSGEALRPLGRSLASIWASTTGSFLPYLDGIALPAEPFNWFYLLLALFAPTSPSLALASYLFIAPTLVYLSVWLLLGLITKRPMSRILPALIFALSPQVLQLQQRGGVVELTAIISLTLTVWLLFSAATAFSPARSWRGIALAGLTGAVLAVSSLPLFALALAISLVLLAFRPERAFTLVWFGLPGIALSMPWAAAAWQIDPVPYLITSSARLSSLEQGVIELALLGIAAGLAALAIYFGRTFLLSGIWLVAGAVVITGSLLPLADYAELPSLLLLLGVIGSAELATSLRGKTILAMASVSAIALAGLSGYFFGFSSEPSVAAGQERQLPALVVAFADVDQSTRTLRLDVGEVIEADLIWGDGISQDEVNLLYERTLPNTEVSVKIAQLAGSVVAGNPAGVGDLMRATSVDFILLAPSEHPSRAEAKVALSTIALLQSSGESEFGSLYRLAELEVGEQSFSQSSFVSLQLGLLAAYLLMAIPTPATIRGYRRLRVR